MIERIFTQVTGLLDKHTHIIFNIGKILCGGCDAVRKGYRSVLDYVMMVERALRGFTGADAFARSDLRFGRIVRSDAVMGELVHDRDGFFYTVDHFDDLSNAV